MPKIGQSGEFLKSKAYGQTVLPDSSLFMGQKLVESAKMAKIQSDNLCYFQTHVTRPLHDPLEFKNLLLNSYLILDT